MNKTHNNLEEVTVLAKAESNRPSNVIPFPVKKIQKQTQSLMSELTSTQIEGAKMMGELPKLTEAEKVQHLARINAERQGANECVLLVMNLG